MLFVFAESAEKSAFVMLRHLFESKVLVCKLFDKLIAHNQQVYIPQFNLYNLMFYSLITKIESVFYSPFFILSWNIIADRVRAIFTFGTIS